MNKAQAFKVAAKAVNIEEIRVKASISDNSIESVLLATDILAALPKNRRAYEKYFNNKISRAQTSEETTALTNNKWVINEITDLMKKIDGKLRRKRSLYES